MVLVGKVNKDIVLRINRHGQPAVGLCGDDGLLFRVSTMTAPGGEDIGFVGRIERVQTGVINHIAEDYIPVIASVGADRDGRSHNVNADEAAGAVARALGAYKVLFLTDVAGWLADPADPRRWSPRPRPTWSRRPWTHVGGGMRPEARGVPGRHPRRRLHRPHRRRPRPALAAARAVHGRRPGDQDLAGAVTLARRQLRALPGRVRDRPRLHAGRRRRQRVPRPAGRHRGLQHGPLPPARRRRRAGAGGAADARLEPLLHARRTCGWRSGSRRPRSGGKVFFCNSGAEANEAAIKLARKRRRGGGFLVAHGGFHGRTYGALSATPQETKQAPFAPLVPGFTALAVGAIAAAVTEETAAVLLEVVQGESGVNVVDHEVLRDIRAACDAHGALLIFDEVQTGMGRTGTLWAYEQTGVSPGRHHDRQGARRRLPDRRADHDARDRRRPRARRPRLDVRRQPARVRGRQRRARRPRRPGAARGRARPRRAPARGLRELPGVRSVRGLGLMVAAEVDATRPDVARRALLEQRLVINATGPGTLRFVPPLGDHRGGGRRGARAPRPGPLGAGRP